MSSGLYSVIKKVTDISGAIQQVDRFHISTHKGYAYSIEYEFILTGTTPQYMVITTGDREIHMQDRSFSSNVSNVSIESYFNPIVTVGATPVAITPRRFSFTKDSTNTVTAQTVDSFTGGEMVPGEIIIYGEEGVGGKSTGTGVSSNREINIPAISMIGLKVQRRTGTGEGLVKLDIGYYEIHNNI